MTRSASVSYLKMTHQQNNRRLKLNALCFGDYVFWLFSTEIKQTKSEEKSTGLLLSSVLMHLFVVSVNDVPIMPSSMGMFSISVPDDTVSLNLARMF